MLKAYVAFHFCSLFSLFLVKDNSTKNWIGTWCKHMKYVFDKLKKKIFNLTFNFRSNEYSSLNENQKVNHFPGCFHLGRKDRLASNLKSLFAQDEDSFHPHTYILPQDLRLLKKAWIRMPVEQRLMILKPPASARGNF